MNKKLTVANKFEISKIGYWILFVICLLRFVISSLAPTVIISIQLGQSGLAKKHVLECFPDKLVPACFKRGNIRGYQENICASELLCM